MEARAEQHDCLYDSGHKTTSDHARAKQLGWPLLLTTLSALVLELSLTRLFSVVLYYHYAFLVISIALLGLASGGLLARLLPRDLEEAKYRTWMAAGCLGASLLLLPCLHFILGTNISLLSSREHFHRLSLLYLLCMLPFMASGVVVASVMVAGSRRIARLYFFDLIGAALGCLLFVPLMRALGGPNTVLAAGVLWAIAARVWARGSHSRRLVRASSGAAVSLVALIVANWNGGLIDVRYTRGMPLKNEVFAKWNTFSRVSVYQDERGERWIELDGGAGTWLSNTDLEGEAGQKLRETLGQTGPEVAFWMSEGREPEALVIGSGGGYDLVRALAAGSKNVTAVEINPIITDDIMRGEFEDYSRGIYKRPEVTVYNEDGRTYLRRTSEHYDVIQLSQVDTWASSASGAYALTENYLYTVEALESYLNHLKRAGIVSISRWEFPEPRETLRLTAIALEALERQGVRDAALHIIVLLERVTHEWPKMGTVIAGKTPFSKAQVEALQEHVNAHPPLELAYAPHLALDDGRPYGRPFQDLILSNDRASFARSYPFDISPVFDDRPFFFYLYRWSRLADSLFSVDLAGDAVNASAQRLLLSLLSLSILAVAAFLFGPLMISRRRFPSGRGSLPPLLYCLLVGLAFILVEIALIQRLVIYLGQPALSLTVVIFAVLLSSSLGSRLSDLFGNKRLLLAGRTAIAGIALMLLLHLFGLPHIIDATQGATVATKIGVAGISILPLGLCMGVPFPSGLRLIAERRKDSLEWAWSVNAASTVLGSVFAILLSMQLGIAATMMIGAASYGAAAALMGRIGDQIQSSN